MWFTSRRQLRLPNPTSNDAPLYHLFRAVRLAPKAPALMPPLLQSQYGLPLYAYLIRWTGTFIFPYSNLATPLFPYGTPLFHT